MNKLALAAILLALPCAGCSTDRTFSAAANDADATRKLVLTGSSTVAPLAAEMARRFERLHPGVRIDVQTGGSSRGVADVRRGTADIGMASRDLNEQESDLHATAIARDGICLIVHRDNPVTELSRDQIIGLFTGRIVNWRQAGGNDAPVTVVNKAEGRSTLELFLGYVDLRSRQIKASVVIGDNEQGIKTVAGNPDAIGYVSVGAAEYSARAGVNIKPLPLDGVQPDAAAIQSGAYPLSRPLMLVTREEPDGLAKEFIQFCRSPDVHDLVRILHFVPLESSR